MAKAKQPGIKVESVAFIDPGRQKAVVEVHARLTGRIKAPRVFTVTFDRHDNLVNGYQFVPEDDNSYLRPEHIPQPVAEAATKLFRESLRG